MGAGLSYPSVELAGKVALVTGGNTGIGYETAKALCVMGAQTFIACRSEEKATAAIQRMKEEVGAEFPDRTVQVEFLPLDLSSFQSTREFVSTFKSKNLPLHILVNNAGVLQAERVITPDGYEAHYQVNHLSPFLLTLELLSCVREAASASGDARIVFVSSSGHRQGVLNPNNMNGETSYGGIKFYCNSKLYNVMTSFALQRRLKDVGVTVSCLHPGAVKTELFRQHESRHPWLFAVVKPVVGVMMRDEKKGAATTINCAVNPELSTQQCVYYTSCQPTATIPTARDLSAQEQLWAMSVAAVKEFLSLETLQDYGQTQQPEASPAQQTGQSESSSGDDNRQTGQSESSSGDHNHQTGQSESSSGDHNHQTGQSESSSGDHAQQTGQLEASSGGDHSQQTGQSESSREAQQLQSEPATGTLESEPATHSGLQEETSRELRETTEEGGTTAAGSEQTRDRGE